MNKRAEQLYQTMLNDMAYCRQKQLDRSTELECLFTICNRYWALIQRDAAHYEFMTGNEEIYFFKTIKPKFISEKLYIGLLNHAQLFKTHVTDRVSLKKLWEQEAQRLEKFIRCHEDFYNYYKADRKEKDAEWFTCFIHSGVTDIEKRTTTAKDHLVSMLLALERYHDYVSEEVKLFSQSLIH
ncbi:MAG: RteC domain-containing protein [Bacteroidota bacterium]|nr:RteC domain-containing protein [Bacteroidota bacterium]